jgi:hypothetical protein
MNKITVLGQNEINRGSLCHNKDNDIAILASYNKQNIESVDFLPKIIVFFFWMKFK